MAKASKKSLRERALKAWATRRRKATQKAFRARALKAWKTRRSK